MYYSVRAPIQPTELSIIPLTTLLLPLTIKKKLEITEKMAVSKMNIIIIGSGLANHGAASVLREHHNVAVYERGGPEAATGGQGNCLFSNGVKVLQKMEFDADRSGGVPCHGYRLFDKAGKRLKDFPIDFKGSYGADTLTMKQSDFRAELLRLATALPADGIKGEPVRMVFNTAVVDVDPEAASVTLGDGSIVQGDVVISKNIS